MGVNAESAAVGPSTRDDVLEGIVERLRDEPGGEGRRVVRFVLGAGDETRHAVETRGAELHGVLSDGDFVAVRRVIVAFLAD